MTLFSIEGSQLERGTVSFMISLLWGAVFIGFAPIFVKAIAMAPTPLGAYRCGIAAVILFFLSVRSFVGPENWRGVKKHPVLLFYLFLAGLLFALDLYVWHRAVIFGGAGIGTILGNTQVFYVALFGILIHGEKITGRFLLSILMAFLGTLALVMYRKSGVGVSDEHYLEGVAYGLATGVVYASYVLTMRKVEHLGPKVSPIFRLAIISGVTALSLFGVSQWEGTWRVPVGVEWAWLIGLALVAQVGGWLFISRGILKVPASRVGLALLLQPTVATISGALFFSEWLTLGQIVGVALTLGGIYLGSLRTQR